MSQYVIKGRYKDGDDSVILPASDGSPIPIGRARTDDKDIRVAPNYVVIQSWLDIPPDLAADLGAVELIREPLNQELEETSDGWVPPEEATLLESGKYQCAAVNKRTPETGKSDATNGQVTAGSAAVIAAMVADQQAAAIEEYSNRIRQALLDSGKKLTAAQKTALTSGALAALQAAKLAP